MYTELRKEYLDEWKIWYRMCNRSKKKQKYYVHIQVCADWDYFEAGGEGFINFFDDMGKRPDPTMFLYRIDKTKDWEPGNVKWGHKPSQYTHMHIKHGHPKEMVELYRKNGIQKSTYYQRIRRGWPPKDAATMQAEYTRYKYRVMR